MRLQSKLICLLLFIALSASGWGTVFASAFCQHQGSPAQHAAAMAKDHSCCHAHLAQQAEHCDTAVSDHDGMSGMEMPATVTPAGEALASLYLIESVPACAQCLSRSAPVRLNLREGNQAGRVMETTAQASPQTLALQVPFVATPVLARQGAPPGLSVHRHILNSIFLI